MEKVRNFEKLYLVNDQVIKIPVEKMVHKVVDTDTIDYILRKYSMTLDELVDLNNDKLLVIDSYLNVK